MNNLVAESFDSFIEEYEIFKNELDSIEKGNSVLDENNNRWTVVLKGTWDDVKEFDTSGETEKLYEEEIINDNDILLAVVNEEKDTAVFVYGEDGVLKEYDNPYTKLPTVSIGLELNESNTEEKTDLYFDPVNEEFLEVNINETGEETVYSIDLDEFIPENFNLDKNIWNKIEESRKQIKRKYGKYSGIYVNEKAPIRNMVISMIGDQQISEEDLMGFLQTVEEDRGKPINKRKWFRRNKKYFESRKIDGKKVWQLSKLGRRIHETINPSEEE